MFLINDADVFFFLFNYDKHLSLKAAITTRRRSWS